MYSNKNDSDLRTPFCTFSSGTRYSFMRAGNTVNGEHVSATIAMATVVHTLITKVEEINYLVCNLILCVTRTTMNTYDSWADKERNRKKRMNIE